MRRLILFLAAACVIAAPTAGAAAAKNGNGAMCVLHARLAAENDTGSTSTATGQTLIQVRGERDDRVQDRDQPQGRRGRRRSSRPRAYASACGTSDEPARNTPRADLSPVERGERTDEVHDRHVLPVAQNDDVDDDDERGREPESERHPCEEVKPTRSHPQSRPRAVRGTCAGRGRRVHCSITASVTASIAESLPASSSLSPYRAASSCGPS